MVGARGIYSLPEQHCSRQNCNCLPAFLSGERIFFTTYITGTMITANKHTFLMYQEDHHVLTHYLQNRQPASEHDRQQHNACLEKINTATVLGNDAFPNSASRLYSTVVIRDTVARTNLEYKLVHPNEADEWNGRISALTPFGLALMGLQKGESFTWQLANKKKYYAVVEVRNASFM